MTDFLVFGRHPGVFFLTNFSFFRCPFLAPNPLPFVIKHVPSLSLSKPQGADPLPPSSTHRDSEARDIAKTISN